MGRPAGALNVVTLAIVEELEARAASDRWVIRSSAARAAGLSATTVRALCEAGRWRPLTRGVCAVAGEDGGGFQLLHAMLLVAGPSAFAQRLSAASLFGGLDLPRTGAIDIAVTRGASGTRMRRRVPERHLTVVEGLRCTDLLLTLLDLASILDAVRWEHALEAALRSRQTTVDDIVAALAAPRRRDPTAVAVVRTVLAARPAQTKPAGSLLETLFIQLARTHGLPEPERQHCVRISPTKRYFVDVAWPELRFFIELNGKDHEKQQLHDADRLAAIVAHTGWSYITLTWQQVVGTPTRTAERVRSILEARERASL